MLLQERSRHRCLKTKCEVSAHRHAALFGLEPLKQQDRGFQDCIVSLRPAPCRLGREQRADLRPATFPASSFAQALEHWAVQAGAKTTALRGLLGTQGFADVPSLPRSEGFAFSSSARPTAKCKRLPVTGMAVRRGKNV